jgi:uncharacterized protein YkwD
VRADASGVRSLARAGLFVAVAAVVLAVCAAAFAVRSRPDAGTAPALLVAVNEARAAHGLAPVSVSTPLARAAASHTRDMLDRQYFDHASGPGGEAFSHRVLRFFHPRPGARLGELLAWGTGTSGGARATVRSWLLSPTHRALLLSPTFTLIGVGVDSGRFQGHRAVTVWTADLGRP